MLRAESAQKRHFLRWFNGGHLQETYPLLWLKADDFVMCVLDGIMNTSHGFYETPRVEMYRLTSHFSTSHGNIVLLINFSVFIRVSSQFWMIPIVSHYSFMSHPLHPKAREKIPGARRKAAMSQVWQVAAQGAVQEAFEET